MPKITIKSGAAQPSTSNVTDSELAFSRDTGKVYVGKGSTAGGAASSVVEVGPFTLADKTEKTTIVNDDAILITDSEALNVMKKAKRSTIVSGLAASGAITSSGLTLATSRILGRITASTGAVEEIEPYDGLKMGSGRISVDPTNATEKTTIDGDDLVLVADSANSNALKKVKRSNFVSGVGTGTVTSVALSLPNLFSVSGSPVTTTGTLSASLANQNANIVLAGPGSGSAAAPTFRALVADDIPSLAASKITSGTFDAARLPDIDGGTY